MSKVGLVIDSTTIISPENISRYHIETVSLNIIVGDKNMREVDTTDQFIIDNLNDAKDIRSASPSPFAFKQAYEKLFAQGYEEIIVVPLSKEVSGTYQVATMAKDFVENGNRIFVIDTNICNFGVANLVETMLPLFDGQHDAAWLAKEFETRAVASDLLFTVTDIKHLVKSGRISRLSATFAEILHIKPIIKMISGKLSVFEKTRSNQRVLDVFDEHIKNLSSHHSVVALKIVYLQNEELLKKLLEMVKTKYTNVKVTLIDRVNPVFLTHLGNSGIGIAATGY